MPGDHISVSKSTTKEIPLVSFANGTFKKESKKRKLTVSAFKDAKHRGSGRKRKLIVAESRKMTYRGENTGALNQHHSSQLYVAEVNRQTGKMTLFPTEVFNMHPVTQEDDSQRNQLDVASMSYREKNDLLMGAFGSGKQKRALQRRQRNKLAEEALTSAMGSVIDKAITAQQQLPAPRVQQTSSAIPPCNMDAESPADVYSLSDIIGSTEIDSLKNAAQEFSRCGPEKLKEWREKNEYYSSVLSRLQVLPMREEQRVNKACLLLYLHYMLTLFHMKSDQIRKKDPLPFAWPEMVKRMMLDRFTVRLDGKKRCIPARVKDLLLSHILVLCLIIDDFTSSLALLHRDLNISSKKLQMHVRALGCKTKSESSLDSSGFNITSYTAMLKIPLTFPQPSKGRKSRK